jgi:hypothetical protein
MSPGESKLKNCLRVRPDPNEQITIWIGKGVFRKAGENSAEKKDSLRIPKAGSHAITAL